MKKEELLLWLKCRFCNEETPCEGCIRLKQGCQEKQAYKQIVALIKKEVTEEWIEEKAKEFITIVNIAIQTPEAYKQQLKICKDFIRSLVEEIKK